MKCPVLLYVYSKCCWNLIFKGFYSSVVSTQDCVSIGCATRRFDIPVPDRVVTPLSLTINCLSPCKLTTMSAAPPCLLPTGPTPPPPAATHWACVREPAGGPLACSLPHRFQGPSGSSPGSVGRSAGAGGGCVGQWSVTQHPRRRTPCHLPRCGWAERESCSVNEVSQGKTNPTHEVSPSVESKKIPRPCN